MRYQKNPERYNVRTESNGSFDEFVDMVAPPIKRTKVTVKIFKALQKIILYKWAINPLFWIVTLLYPFFNFRYYGIEGFLATIKET